MASGLVSKVLSRLKSYGMRRGLKGDAIWLAVGIVSWLLLREKARSLRPVWRGKVAAGEKLEITVGSPRGRRQHAGRQ